MFVIFINDIVDCCLLISASHMSLYADDLKLLQVKSLDDCLQGNSDSLASWGVANKLALNIDMCSIMSDTYYSTLLLIVCL